MHFTYRFAVMKRELFTACDVDRETLEGVYTGQANGLIKSFTYTNYSYALMQCQSHIGVIVPHNVVNPC